MFPMIWAAIFFDSVDRRSRVRLRVGMMRAREGGSMTWTNSVSRSDWRQACALLDGSASDSRSIGTSTCISGFFITEPICLRAVLPAFCTLECESARTSMSRGTILGRQEESCFGAQKAMAPRSSALPAFVRHESSSRAVRREGRISLTPWLLR